MVSVPSPFGADDDTFDAYDEFVPEHVPVPGEFLDGHQVLTDRRHFAVHRLACELFEERAVYDMTFGYNLARLNCDTRHSDAGYRYAVEDAERTERADDPDDADDTEDPPTVAADARVLRAEFTPTTAFCPQSDTLTKGSFRAWNGLADRHEFDLVRVRVAPMHQRSVPINAALRELAATYLETGEMPDPSERAGSASGPETAIDDGVPGAPEPDESRTPF